MNWSEKYATPWLNSEQAAQYLSISLSGMRNLIRQRRIPYSKRGGIVRFHVGDLDAWLRDGVREPLASRSESGKQKD